ncbi:MAG TPA: NAD(P)/FAD-dependent oxidoreductase [Arsenicitalea sp.]|nr:NAD(P)/FAD-dependent oxidoreductase [Arsenicitalea sp.]
MPSPKPRILVVGAGIAGSLITAGLAGRSDVDVICVERSPKGSQMDEGTGLNLGPNAIKALRACLPEWAERLVANSLPWKRWTIGLTDGRPLMDLALDTVADNPGIRIRWAELYALLRRQMENNIRFGTQLLSCERGPSGGAAIVRNVATGSEERIEDIDLIIAADGRYSAARDSFVEPETPAFLGVCLYRLLFPAGDACPIDDYGQWFNGPNRLLAFQVPGNFVYVAGSFPIPMGAETPEHLKSAEALRRAYTPPNGTLSPQADYLVRSIETYHNRIHWARLQDGAVRFAGPAGVLFVGDAAHPMVPTLGQGATQSVEDACVVVDEILGALDRKADLVTVPSRVEERRSERARFVVSFSRDATDTMLAGADPVAGTLKKTEPEFLAKLTRLYRDTPEPQR